MSTYSVEDGHGTYICEGLAKQTAQATAQRLADKRGEAVYLREAGSDDEPTKFSPVDDRDADDIRIALSEAMGWDDRQGISLDVIESHDGDLIAISGIGDCAGGCYLFEPADVAEYVDALAARIKAMRATHDRGIDDPGSYEDFCERVEAVQDRKTALYVLVRHNVLAYESGAAQPVLRGDEEIIRRALADR